jgi:hypothetical protein
MKRKGSGEVREGKERKKKGGGEDDTGKGERGHAERERGYGSWNYTVRKESRRMVQKVEMKGTERKKERWQMDREGTRNRMK